MKRWKACLTEEDRQAALDEALSIFPDNHTLAAAALGISRQHFHRVRGEIAAPEAADTAGGRILIPLPKHCLDWLEREALRRKQETGASRMAKGPIVAELIEAAMRQERKPEARS